MVSDRDGVMLVEGMKSDFTMSTVVLRKCLATPIKKDSDIGRQLTRRMKKQLSVLATARANLQVKVSSPSIF